MPVAERLVAVSRELSQASTLEQVQAVARSAARELSGADGAVVAIRDGDHCRFVDEDAIEPVFEGRRSPLSRCIAGWSMLHRAPAVIEDIYADDRVVHGDFRRTFVNSLVVVPIRRSDPVGALAIYWARRHRPPVEVVDALQALADITAVAMERARAETPRGASPQRPMPGSERCRNLYSFMRLRLGSGLSDRELARRWGMSWRSFLNLKEGSRRVPRLEELESLADVLEVDVALVVLVARGEAADTVNRWLLEGDTAVRRGLLARLAFSAPSSAAPMLHSSIDRIPCGLLTVDLQGRIRDSNARLAALVADSDAFSLGVHFINFVAPDSAPTILRLQTQALEAGESGPELVRLDSGALVGVSMVGITDRAGRTLGFQGVLQPVPDAVADLLDGGGDR